MEQGTECRTLRLFVDGGNGYGDLIVSGFVTDRTALEIGAEFAEALRKYFPGAHVTAELVETEGAPGE